MAAWCTPMRGWRSRGKIDSASFVLEIGSGCVGQLAIQRFPIPQASAQEFRPGRHRDVGRDRLGQQPPQLGVIASIDRERCYRGVRECPPSAASPRRSVFRGPSRRGPGRGPFADLLRMSVARQLKPSRSVLCRHDSFRTGPIMPHVSIFTYSKSPGLLSMPTFGGEIQGA